MHAGIGWRAIANIVAYTGWEWITGGAFPGLAPVYRGREGALDLWEALKGPWDNQALYVEIKRVEDLEKIAGGFPGVEKTFAVQAGREIRVFVQPNQIGDEQAFVLARNIASKIENDLQYPGQIKVTVIRETRCVEVAK